MSMWYLRVAHGDIYVLQVMTRGMMVHDEQNLHIGCRCNSWCIDNTHLHSTNQPIAQEKSISKLATLQDFRLHTCEAGLQTDMRSRATCIRSSSLSASSFAFLADS